MIPKNALELAKHFEGWSSKPYICPAGFWTIGYGHLWNKKYPSVIINKEQGEKYLQQDMMSALRGTIKYCPILLRDSEEMLGAIVDFVFNLGVGRLQMSTLRRRINQRNWNEVVKELQKWVYGGGKKLPGLILRRKAESLFFNRKGIV